MLSLYYNTMTEEISRANSDALLTGVSQSYSKITGENLWDAFLETSLGRKLTIGIFAPIMALGEMAVLVVFSVIYLPFYALMSLFTDGASMAGYFGDVGNFAFGLFALLLMPFLGKALKDAKRKEADSLNIQPVLSSVSYGPPISRLW